MKYKKINDMKKMTFFSCWIILSIFGFLYQSNPKTAATGILGEWWCIISVCAVGALCIVGIDVFFDKLKNKKKRIERLE